MVCCPGQRVHSSGGHNFETFHDKKIKFSGFSFLDGHTDLTKYQQNPCGSGGKSWLIPHEMTHICHFFSDGIFMSRHISNFVSHDFSFDKLRQFTGQRPNVSGMSSDTMRVGQVRTYLSCVRKPLEVINKMKFSNWQFAGPVKILISLPFKF